MESLWIARWAFRIGVVAAYDVETRAGNEYEWDEVDRGPGAGAGRAK